MMFFRSRSEESASGRSCARGLAAAAVAAGLLGTGLLCTSTAARAADTSWTSGTTPGAWSTAGNWSNGVPDSTTNAYTTSSGASILLGAGAQAKTFFVEGPIGGESVLVSGSLALSDQLWINIASGNALNTAVPLRLYDPGSAPVSVTANNATLGADPGNQGVVMLDSRTGGNVTFAVTNTLTIGYDGSGNAVYSYRYPSGGTGSITANTIQTSVIATAGADDYNLIRTYNPGDSVTATNLVLGVNGSRGGADNYGGNWTIANTSLGDQSTSGTNYITITDGGTFTNSGAFAVGVRGSGNYVQVGYADQYVTPSGSNGTLRLTGPNDLVIGLESTADNNSVVVREASTLSANGNIVVGIDGTNGQFNVNGGSTVTSGGARLGVNAGSSGNAVQVYGATWTMNGSVRVGDKGSDNEFVIGAEFTAGGTVGGTVTLTGAGQNFYVGYDRSATGNTLAVVGANSTLSVKAAGADLVVSGNVTGTGANSTDNLLFVYEGGVIDANRTLVGDGGQISGDLGTIKGDVVVYSGGTIAPAVFRFFPGALTFTDNVDLSNGGTLFALTGPGGTVGNIDVDGTLTLGGSSVLDFAGATDPGTAYIIAQYGTLSGVFSSITGLPAGATIDYNYLSLNQIAIIVAAAVPEIALASAGSAFALIACSLALLERRGLRRRKPPA